MAIYFSIPFLLLCLLFEEMGGGVNFIGASIVSRYAIWKKNYEKAAGTWEHRAKIEGNKETSPPLSLGDSLFCCGPLCR